MISAQLKRGGLIIFLGITKILLSTSCSGDGIGLNEFGDIVEYGGGNDSLDVSVPLEATIGSLEMHVFGAVCAVKCHRPPSPKKNLNLEPGSAYEYLVNVQSEERPEMLRVAPADAENSYIIWKLEGRRGIKGKRMPLNLPALSEGKIQAVREWIDNGAVQ